LIIAFRSAREAVQARRPRQSLSRACWRDLGFQILQQHVVGLRDALGGPLERQRLPLRNLVELNVQRS